MDRWISRFCIFAPWLHRCSFIHPWMVSRQTFCMNAAHPVILEEMKKGFQWKLHPCLPYNLPGPSGNEVRWHMSPKWGGLLRRSSLALFEHLHGWQHAVKKENYLPSQFELSIFLISFQTKKISAGGVRSLLNDWIAVPHLWVEASQL